MDLIKVGKEARKTGFKAREGLVRDKYDMEDIDEFFAEGSIVGDATKSTRQNVILTRQHPPLHRTPIPKPIDKLEKTELLLSPHVEDLGALGLNSRLNPVIKSTGLEHDQAIFDTQADDFQDITFDDIEDRPNDEIDDELLEQQSTKGFTKAMVASNSSNTKRLKELGDKKPGNIQFTDQDNDLLQDSLLYPVDDDVSSQKDNAVESHEASPRKAVKRGNFEYKSIDDIPDWEDEEETSGDDEFHLTQDDPVMEGAGIRSLLPSPPPESRNLRRSKRTKVKPLDFWRNERIVYTRADEDFLFEKENTLINDLKKVPLQEITEIIHVKDTNPRPKKRKALRKPPKKTASKDEELNPLWFADGVKEVEVFLGDESVTKQEVAWTANGVTFKDTTSDDDTSERFLAAPLFRSSSGSISTGLIDLPINGFKSLRSSNDMTCVFHVTEGRIEVELNQDRFVVLPGCSFVVPTSNIYSLRNVGQTGARLFFVQCKD